MTDTAPISVIIPAINSARYLRDTVASMRAQTLLPAAVMALTALVTSGCASSNRLQNARDAAIADRALIAAAEQGRADVARYALEQGADVDARDADRGRTSLMLAAERGDLEVMAGDRFVVGDRPHPIPVVVRLVADVVGPGS